MYITEGNEQKIHNIYLAEKNALPGDQEQVTVKQALCSDDRYKVASWTAILIMAFQCLTGYYAIIAYSSVLLRDDFGAGSDRKINAR